MIHKSCPYGTIPVYHILEPFFTFHRATVKKGVTFRTATPSNSVLWDITLDMDADGVIAVVCQRKAPIPGKRQVLFTLWATVCNVNFMFCC